MNIYVGNLPRQTTQDELQEAFEAFGTVDRAVIILDRDTGQSRGFGFVEMPDKAEAEAAIAGMNGTDLGGRTLTVNEAKPREPRSGGGSGGRFGGGRSGGGRPGGSGGGRRDDRRDDRRGGGRGGW
ncbi:MAG: RNA-binding protein [Anaerolineales bacterium]|nr:RNA-binding protein [Anaerolineales bacterium]MCB8954115.1 RNA-binding protein [Ardenticatenales bacterium]